MQAQTPTDPAYTTFSALMEGLHAQGDGWRASVTPDWMQGRTLYGGLSAALALEAVLRGHPGLPPLKSAQISFVGPVSGEVHVTSRVVRAGRSVSFIAADVDTEAGPGTRALFGFASGRTSALEQAIMPMPPVAGPDDCPVFFDSPMRPGFSGHFDVRLADGDRPVSGAAQGRMTLWIRLRDAWAGDPLVALFALADAPPPAAMAMFTAPAPISTASWMLNVLDAGALRRDDWVLCRTVCDHVSDGYSSQSMALWNAAGVPVASALQSVAVYA